MKISVVIPAHNEEASVARVIEALLAQRHPDFEVILVDNASVDRTAEVAQRFPVKVVHEPQKGLLHARERGRREAEGELIANIDADCLPEADWLARATRHFEDGSVVAVTGPYDYHDAAPSFRMMSLATQRYLYRPISRVLQAPFIRGGAVLIGGNNLIRAEALDKVGGYNTALLFYGEDTDTAKRIAPYGKVVFDPSLAMKTSARRFKAEGTLRLMGKYWYHFFKQIFSRKKAA